MKIQLVCLFSILSLQAASSRRMIEFVSVHAKNNEQLFIQDGNFMVQHMGETTLVQPAFIDKHLLNRSVACLSAMQQHGYVNINKLDNNTYKLDFQSRGLGGGPVTGFIAYWVTKAVCWTSLVTAAGSAVLATGGALAGAGAAAAGASAVTAATAGMTTAVGIPVATIATTAAIAGPAAAGASALVATTTAGAAAVTVGVGATAATGVGIVGAIEAASMGAYTIFTLIPFLP